MAEEEDEPRFTMLETIREFGLERLTASGEMEATRQAHAFYYFALAEEAAPELTGPRSAVWLQRLEREHDNLRAALEWSLEPEQTGSSPDMALRFCETLREFWDVRGHNSEGRAFLEQALAALPKELRLLHEQARSLLPLALQIGWATFIVKRSCCRRLSDCTVSLEIREGLLPLSRGWQC